MWPRSISLQVFVEELWGILFFQCHHLKCQKNRECWSSKLSSNWWCEALNKKLAADPITCICQIYTLYINFQISIYVLKQTPNGDWEILDTHLKEADTMHVWKTYSNIPQTKLNKTFSWIQLQKSWEISISRDERCRIFYCAVTLRNYSQLLGKHEHFISKEVIKRNDTIIITKSFEK